MNKFSIKFISLFLIIAFNASGFLAVGEAMAYFSDNENSLSNIFQTGVLDMTVRSGQANFVSGADNMTPGKQVNRDIYIGKTALSLPLNHNVIFEFIGGDIDLCSQLDLKIWYNHYFDSPSGGYANRDMRLVYNDKLSVLNSYTHSDFEIPHFDDWFDTDPTDGTEQWFYYSIILPADISDSFQGKVCNFNFVYSGWDTDMPDSSSGFTDKEEIANTIKTGYWKPPVVLNEFLPTAGDYQEFIELYNQTGSPIDLTGFYIATGSGTIPINLTTTATYHPGGLTTIPASGWLVVTAGGDLINNTSGTITLYNPNNIVVDAYTYGSPKYNVNNTPDWTNNLAAYLPFDGDLLDKSGNGNNGTSYGQGFVTGKINQALNFDGDDNVVVSGAGSLNSPEVTLEAWVKNSGTPGTYKYITDKHYLGDRGSYALYTSGSGGLRFYIGHTAGFVASPDAGTGIWDGNWHHIVGTYDGLKVQLYVDGTEIGSGTATTVTIAYNSNSLYIGSYGSGFYWKGIIDEVKIYNHALSITEIWAHYNDVGTSGAVPVDKSYARIPDGSSNWVDPIPTPGQPNKLDVSIEPIEMPLQESGPITSELPVAEGIIAQETQEIITEETTIEEAPAEEVAGGGIVEIIDNIVGEIIPDGTIEEPAIEPIIDETTVVEEVLTAGELVIEEVEEAPVIEETVDDGAIIEESSAEKVAAEEIILIEGQKTQNEESEAASEPVIEQEPVLEAEEPIEIIPEPTPEPESEVSAGDSEQNNSDQGASSDAPASDGNE